MMKKILGKTVLVALILVLALISAFSIVSAATSVYVEPSLTTVKPGENFSVGIAINTNDNVYAVEINLVFNPNILNASSVTEGDFLKQGGASTSFPFGVTINNTIGKIIFPNTRLGAQSGATGTGSLIIINFNIKSVGLTNLDITKVQLIRYPDLSEIPVDSITNGTIIVNNPPVASNLQIIPSLPKTTDNLVANYSYYDVDGNLESGSEIRWYKNSILQTTYNDLKTLPNSATSKGENWYFTVKPKDSISFGQLKTSLNVTIQNSAPVLQAIGNKIVNEEQLLQFTVSANDDDNDTLTYTSINLPLGASFSNKQFSWTPNYTQAGAYQVTFNVSDGTGSASEKISIIVNNVNRVPIINWFSPSSLVLAFREGFSLFFNHTSSDLDNDVLVYSWKLDNIQKATAKSWVFSPNDSLCGSHNIKLEVSDAQDSASKTWNVTINLRGDVDLDRDVDIFDLAAVGLAYRIKTGEANWNKNADIHPGPGVNSEPEGNGQIDIFDLATVGLNYGRTC